VGVYSAPPDPLAGFKGAYLYGEGEGKRGRVGVEKEEGRKGRGGIGVNFYWAQGLKPPPHFYNHGARHTGDGASCHSCHAHT